jgi:predicted GNAT family acetyltransferase
MTELHTYATPQAYLDAALGFLAVREVENGLLIGLPGGFPDTNAPQPNCHFLTCSRNGAITAASVKTWAKAIVAGAGYGEEELRLLSDYYRTNDNNMQGVVGETSIAKAFAKIYHSGDVTTRAMITHELTSIKTLTRSSGSFETASMDDIELLTDWYVAFNDEVHSRPRLTREETKKNLTVRIEAGNVFLWRDEGKLVSIAAIVRKTPNSAIIGIVYTPPELRGKGYASSVVSKLTEHILSSGFTKCGLFTEADNPISNGIYRKIGYEPIGEYMDIMFM